MIVRRVFWISALAMIAAAGCNTEKRRLLERTAQLEQQRDAIQARIDARRNVLHETQVRLDALNSELAQHNKKTHAYILQHQTAAACIRAATITLGEQSEYRAHVGAMARLGTVVCAVALLNRRFANEVTQVTNAIDEAESRARQIKNEIVAVQRTIDADQARIGQDERELDRIAADLSDARQRLALQ